MGLFLLLQTEAAHFCCAAQCQAARAAPSAATSGWEQNSALSPSCLPNCARLNVQIGKDCGITSGKWMVRTTPDDEAVVWGTVAQAVYVQVCRWPRCVEVAAREFNCQC